MSEKEKDLSESKISLELEIKDIEIKGHKFKIKQFNIDEYNAVKAAQFDMQMVGENPVFSYVPGRASNLLLKWGVVESPVDLKDTTKIPGYFLNELCEKIKEFNHLTEKKSKS